MPTFAITQLRQFFRHHSFISVTPLVTDSECYFTLGHLNAIEIYLFTSVFITFCLVAFCAYRIIASNALCHKACRSVSRDN